MKTISLIAVSTLLGSAVSGQMIAPEKAEQGMDFQEMPQPHKVQEFPQPPKGQEFPQPPKGQEFPVPKPRAPTPKGHAVPTKERVVPAKGHPVPHRVQGMTPNKAAEVVHVTKTKTRIIYPTPNEQLWENLPTLPSYKHRGKIVAEFYVDDKGHYHEIKHGHHHGLRYTNGWNQDEYHNLVIDGEHVQGKVIYGGPWRGSGTSSHQSKGGYKHKESHEDGKEDYRHHQDGKNMHEEYRHQDDKKAHEEHRKGDSRHDDKQKNNNKKNEKDPQTNKNKNDWKKKTSEGYQAKGIEGIITQNNASTPIDTGASGSAVEGAVSASISASAGAAQKTPAAGSASAMAGASAKNAAASSTSASHTSSPSANGSSSTTTSPTSAASNTRQVALSFVAVIAATAVWCLA